MTYNTFTIDKPFESDQFFFRIMYISGPITIRIENVGAVKLSDVEFNTIAFDNPNISSAAANQLAAIANKQSSNPFAVSYLTLVYIEYAVIFGIPAAVAATVVIAYHYRKPRL